MRSTAKLLFVLLGVSVSACVGDAEKNADESATDTSDITAAEHDTELRDALRSADPSGLWFRCTRGRGQAKIVFDVLTTSGSSNITVQARYFAADYNAAFGGAPKVEVPASLGEATLTGTEIVHRIFAFKIHDEAATLDVLGETGSFLRFRGHDYKMTCDSFDF